LPSTGTLAHLHFPEHVAFTRHLLPDAPTPAAVRVDSGVRPLDEISPHYDPMIAKLIVWGELGDTPKRADQEADGDRETQEAGPFVRRQLGQQSRGLAP
jgi:acetyl/propionyl-CoA carboxylase alpha subunit